MQHTCPTARSAERSWYGVMHRYLEQLRDLSYDPDTLINIPIICAGDITSKWNDCPELVNFLIEYLPAMYAVPGNHDLPHHSYEDMKKSIFWTLVKIGRVTLIRPEQTTNIAAFNNPFAITAYGFPYGHKLKACPKELDDFQTNEETIHLAVVHAYIWRKTYCFKDAPKKYHLSKYLKVLKTYDAAVFGDNHKGFLFPKYNILNGGTFMRRNIDEVDYRPFVGLLHRSGAFSKHFLDTSEDKFIQIDDDIKEIASVLNLDEFVVGLEELQDKMIDFLEIVRQRVMDDDIKKSVRDFVIRVLEKRYGRKTVSRTKG